MRNKDPLLALIFTVFLAVLWLGFLFHRDPRFAGSTVGAIFAVSGSFLLLVPLFYSVIKRIDLLKKSVIKKVSFTTLLTIHIYSGFIGAILVLIHTGHKFEGILATGLTALLLIVVFSGYTGRYLLSRSSKDVSDQKTLLSSLENNYAKKVVELHSQPAEKKLLANFSGLFSRSTMVNYFNSNDPSAIPSHRVDVFKLAESIADLEYAISTHQLFKQVFSVWLKIHIGLSVLFYFLLILHIGGQYYFGLRWFQ